MIYSCKWNAWVFFFWRKKCMGLNFVEYVHIQHHINETICMKEQRWQWPLICQCDFCLMKTPNIRINKLVKLISFMCMIYRRNKLMKWNNKKKKLTILFPLCLSSFRSLIHMHVLTSNFQKSLFWQRYILG